MRGYSYEFVRRIRGLARYANAPVGVKLGVTAIDRGVPIMLIARELQVSRMAVYDWFTGKYTPNPERVKQLRALLNHK